MLLVQDELSNKCRSVKTDLLHQELLLKSKAKRKHTDISGKPNGAADQAFFIHTEGRTERAADKQPS